jgi:hypothetical protein
VHSSLKDDTSEADWLPAEARIEVTNEEPVIDCRRDSNPDGQYPGDDEQRVQEWPSLLVRSHCQHPAPCADRAQLEIAFGGMARMPPCSPRFDQGLVSFSDDGIVLVSARLRHYVKRLSFE